MYLDKILGINGQKCNSINDVLKGTSEFIEQIDNMPLELRKSIIIMLKYWEHNCCKEI